MKGNRSNQNQGHSSNTPYEQVKNERQNLSNQQRDQVVNRLFEINQNNNDQITPNYIQKIHQNQKKQMNRQKSMPTRSVQDSNDNEGHQQLVDKSQFGIKQSIHFQIPSYLPLIGSYKCFIYFGCFLWFYFLLFGIVTFGLALSNQLVSLRYDNYSGCQGQEICEIEFEISNHLKAPVHVYYSLGTFYQNHYQYQDSIVYEQLRGETVEESILKDKCEGALLNKDMIKNKLSPDEVANPCGMASKWVFNDEFELVSMADDKKSFGIDKKGIALHVDKDEKFKRPEDFEKIAFRDVENEDFMNWINTPTLPQWKKLYGTIKTSIDTGKYKIAIKNNFDPNLATEKTLYFQSSSTSGGKNVSFGIVLIITSFVFLFGTIYLIFKSRKSKVQQEFDPKDLLWQ